MPVPIAKKTTNGRNLYGTLMTLENASIKGADTSTPKIKNIIESACLIPLREVINNPTISGSKRKKL